LITEDDIVYIIVTDRYADGDPSNNGDVDHRTDDARLVVLNNSREATDFGIPIQANPRLSTLARTHLHDGLHLVNELDPDEQAQILEGQVRVRLPGKTGAVYRATEGRLSAGGARKGVAASGSAGAEGLVYSYHRSGTRKRSESPHVGWALARGEIK
jgi:hypothetical protein